MRNPLTLRVRDERGFTLPELMVSMLLTLIVTGAAMGTFQNAMTVNDSASQLADANQNLRAGMNQMIKDIMQAGRIIGPEGVPVPTGNGAAAIKRPGPPGQDELTFDLSTTTTLPDITTGHELGPKVNGVKTDIITILTVDPFMPTVTLAPDTPANGSIDASGGFVTLPAAATWMTGDEVNDTPPIKTGDLILFKNPNGTAMQTVTGMDSTKIYFDAGDAFGFNQRSAAQGTILKIDASNQITMMFRVLMMTYYVDNTTTPGAPRLMRQINQNDPQALAGVVEDLKLTYDLVDGIENPVQIASLPYTDTTVSPSVTYNSNQIRSVNIHAGVRSEMISRPMDDYVRNHISTSVDVRSLASVDRYVQ